MVGYICQRVGIVEGWGKCVTLVVEGASECVTVCGKSSMRAPVSLLE